MIKRRKAEVKKRRTKLNEYGSEVISFEDLGVIRGVLDYLTITKGEVAQKIIEDSTHIFVCETKLDIEQGDRVVIGNVEYEVNFVDRPAMSKRAEIELKRVLQQSDMLDTFIYYGFSTENNLIEADVLNFENQEFNKKVFSKELMKDEGKLFIVYPKSFGKASIRLNRKPITTWEISELMINGITHYVYSTEVDNDKVYIELF